MYSAWSSSKDLGVMVTQEENWEEAGTKNQGKQEDTFVPLSQIWFNKYYVLKRYLHIQTWWLLRVEYFSLLAFFSFFFSLSAWVVNRCINLWLLLEKHTSGHRCLSHKRYNLGMFCLRRGCHPFWMCLSWLMCLSLPFPSLKIFCSCQIYVWKKMLQEPPNK